MGLTPQPASSALRTPPPTEEDELLEYDIDLHSGAAQDEQGRSIAEVEYHEGQVAVLTGPERFKICTAGRRWGKSETGGTWTLLKAQEARRRGMRGVGWVVAPTIKHLRTNWRKIINLAPKGWITHTTGSLWHPDSITIGGTVTIEFRSAHKPENLVGEGLLFLWADECGLIKETAWNESLRPTLVDYAAPALLTGTPKGRNWYHRMAMRGMDPLDDEHGFYGGTSYENPFVPWDEVDKLADEMTERAYEQEILARFLANEGAVFKDPRAAVARMAKQYGGRLSTAPTVVMGIDLARRHDFTVIIGLDAQKNVTYFERIREIDWPFQKARIKAVYERLGGPAIVIDQTGVGDSFVQDLQLEIFNVQGFIFTPASKKQLVENLVIGFETEQIGLPDEPVLVNELEIFDMKVTAHGNTRYTAPEGAHDDCVMALGLANLGAERYGDLGITV